MLEVNSVVAGYSGRTVLRDVSLKVDGAKIVALIGHNGAGKSTLLKTIFGILPCSGAVLLESRDITQTTPAERLALGMAYVPQGNCVFGDLTVMDNLLVGGNVAKHYRKAGEPIEAACTRFPQLRPLLRRRAGLLSGGEKQLLSISMTLVWAPKLLLLDEPSLGLSPGAVSEVFKYIARLRDDEGLAIIIAEQKVVQVIAIADEICALKTGSVVFNGKASEVQSVQEMKRIFL